jgi:hypothetical protein
MTGVIKPRDPGHCLSKGGRVIVFTGDQVWRGLEWIGFYLAISIHKAWRIRLRLWLV